MSKKITARELEILKLIAQGMINRVISEKLSISIYTVETHRKNIREKLGARNTASLMMIAKKKGLL